MSEEISRLSPYKVDKEFLILLKHYANLRTWEDIAKEDKDYLNPKEFSGGNYDDAYSGGWDSGAQWLAKELLAKLGIEI